MEDHHPMPITDFITSYIEAWVYTPHYQRMEPECFVEKIVYDVERMGEMNAFIDSCGCETALSLYLRFYPLTTHITIRELMKGLVRYLMEVAQQEADDEAV